MAIALKTDRHRPRLRRLQSGVPNKPHRNIAAITDSNVCASVTKATLIRDLMIMGMQHRGRSTEQSISADLRQAEARGFLPFERIIDPRTRPGQPPRRRFSGTLLHRPDVQTQAVRHIGCVRCPATGHSVNRRIGGSSPEPLLQKLRHARTIMNRQGGATRRPIRPFLIVAGTALQSSFRSHRVT